jgi:hypothetical protein
MEQEIINMMRLLEFSDREEFPLSRFVLSDGSYPCCNNKGLFFKIKFLTKTILPYPSVELLKYTHSLLKDECIREMHERPMCHGMNNLGHLLSKFYHLEFIKK